MKNLLVDPLPTTTPDLKQIFTFVLFLKVRITNLEKNWAISCLCIVVAGALDFVKVCEFGIVGHALKELVRSSFCWVEVVLVVENVQAHFAVDL